MQHPDMNAIEAYSRRALRGAEMLALGDHFAQCEDCRGALRSLAVGGRGVEAMPGEDVALHLSEQEVASAASDAAKLDVEARAHLAGCGQCQEEVDAAREFYSPVVTMQPKKKEPVAWVGWVALAAAGVAMAVVIPHVYRDGVRDGASSGPVMVAELHDGGGVIGLNADGGLSGGSMVSAENSALLVQALKSHRLPVQAAAVEMGASEGLRGDGVDAAGFDVVAPRAETTLALPAFRWEALPQAKSYRVALYDSNFNLVAESAKLRTTEWTPSAALQPGGQYRWVVKAETAQGIVQAPSSSAKEARFTVADANTMAAIEAAQKQSGDAHLLLATLYAKAGMRSLARAEVDRLAQENPGSELVGELSESLKDEPQLPPSKTKPAQ